MNQKIIAFWEDYFGVDGKLVVEFDEIMATTGELAHYLEGDFKVVVEIDTACQDEWEKTLIHELAENNPEDLFDYPADMPKDIIDKLEKAREDFLDKTADILIEYRETRK